MDRREGRSATQRADNRSLRDIANSVRGIEHILRAAHQRPKATCFGISGPTGDYKTMLNLKLSETGTVIFTFQDTTQTPPVSYPLASFDTPTVDDPAKATLTVLTDGTKDGIAKIKVTPLPTASPGPFNVLCLGHGEADGSDDIPGTYPCTIIANDDNSVVGTSTKP
jgi:hypothetical protein